MKKTTQSMNQVRQALTAALTVLALASPAVQAQTAEEFKQLKTLVDQMKQTIDAQNSRIADLEKSKAAKPAAATPGVSAETSPSVKTVEKIAAGGQVGQQSPVTYRGALNDQQEAASRPKDFTLDPKYQGFIPVPNTPALIKFNAKPHLDLISDNRNAGNQNRFVPAVFPLKGASDYGGGEQFHMNANATQLRLDVRAPEMDGNFRFYYQNDFFGSGSDTGSSTVSRLASPTACGRTRTAGRTRWITKGPTRSSSHAARWRSIPSSGTTIGIQPSASRSRTSFRT
jgi:hypothetical protein